MSTSDSQESMAHNSLFLTHTTSPLQNAAILLQATKTVSNFGITDIVVEKRGMTSHLLTQYFCLAVAQVASAQK